MLLIPEIADTSWLCTKDGSSLLFCRREGQGNVPERMVFLLSGPNYLSAGS